MQGLIYSEMSESDVYEFHCSPESNKATSPILPTLSATILQKSTQITSLNSGENIQPTLTLSTSFVNSYSNMSQKAIDESINLQKGYLNSNNGSPLPKRIKTATLAKELLAAAAASASPLNVLGNSLASTSTSTTFNNLNTNFIKQNIEKEKNDFSEINLIGDSNKKVPPLRILLPKTPSSEDDITFGSTFAEADNITTVDVDTLVISEADISSGSETQFPMLKNNETSEELITSTTKKNRNQVKTEEPSQQRLTRSRLRQTGAVISDDITSYPTSAKRKGATNLRSRATKQEKTTPAREILDSRTFIRTLTLNDAKSGFQNDEIDLTSVVSTDISSLITENLATFASLDDEECSRQSFDTSGGGKQDEDCEEDEDANEKEIESNANDLAVTLLFSKNSFKTSLEFNQLIQNKWIKDFTREIKQLEIDKKEIENCVGNIVESYKLQNKTLKNNLEKYIQSENDLKISLPLTLKNLYNEHVKHRIHLCTMQFNEREKFLNHSVREYCRTTSTQKNQCSIFNATRLLRDSELYNPFTPNLLINEANNSNSTYLTSKSQVFKRLNAINIAMRNRQNMESYSLYVTQLAEWQKAVKKFNRFQLKRKKELQKNNRDEEHNIDEWNTFNNENNQQLINSIVRLVPVKELFFSLNF